MDIFWLWSMALVGMNTRVLRQPRQLEPRVDWVENSTFHDYVSPFHDRVVYHGAECNHDNPVPVCLAACRKKEYLCSAFQYANREPDCHCITYRAPFYTTHEKIVWEGARYYASRLHDCPFELGYDLLGIAENRGLCVKNLGKFTVDTKEAWAMCKAHQGLLPSLPEGKELSDIVFTYIAANEEGEGVKGIMHNTMKIQLGTIRVKDGWLWAMDGSRVPSVKPPSFYNHMHLPVLWHERRSSQRDECVYADYLGWYTGSCDSRSRYVICQFQPSKAMFR